MAPSRGNGKATAAGTPQASRRPTRARRRKAADDDVPDVYSAMLSEAHTDGESGGDRRVKKRKTTALESANHGPSDVRRSGIASRLTNGGPQTIEDSSESEGSEYDFEDVAIDQPPRSPGKAVEAIEDLSISVEPESSTPAMGQARRKPIGTIEKAHRLLVHKLHVLCLLGHCMFVNGRCNNAIAQGHLRSILSVKTISYLNPSKRETQFQRNRSFMDGLEQAVSAFTAEYRITGSGLRKPHWNVDGDVQQTTDGYPIPVDSSEFIAAAQNLDGSQDMANQLFCAMLRSAGVDARIVCSLQVLPFNSVPKAATPKKPTKSRIMAMPPYDEPTGARAGEDDAAVSSSRTVGRVPSARRRLGQPTFAAEVPVPAAPPTKPARVVKLSYPVFWVEAFNEASQKWVPIDPIVTHTIDKPTKLEPPALYNLNQLTYVVALEADGTARDVTRRYAKAYNAKTRRQRVESARDGTRWFKKVMRVFRRQGGLLDRDQVEDAEMAQKEAKEGLPANVLDFKDHPYYALERHLKRHEIIHPKREVGKVNAGTAAKPKMESVYRRRDVLSCKSADKWYRCGRDIKAGEQPLKHVPARARRQALQEPDAESTTDHAATTALYAPHQTQLYVPPPVQHGRVPRNMFGNLDIYTPTMIPAGGVHIRHALTQQAARLLHIDYADAVTGFQFKGRHGTAIVDGAVIADQYADAVRTTIDGMEFEALEDESRARSMRALKTWKRFLAGLRIAERVRMYGDTERTHADDTDNELFASLVTTATDEELLTAGRFSLKELERKKSRVRKRKAITSDSEEDFDFTLDGRSDKEAGGFIVESDRAEEDDNDEILPNVDACEVTAEQEDSRNGGDFVTEDINEVDCAGGFLPEGDAKGDGGCGHAGTPGQSADEEMSGGFTFKGPADAEFAGGFFPDEDLAATGNDPNSGLVREDESIAERTRVDEAETTIRGTHSTDTQTDAESTAKAHASDSHSTASLQHDEDVLLEDAESDSGSMPSHDPEDDEAEPDWLESD